MKSLFPRGATTTSSFSYGVWVMICLALIWTPSRAQTAEFTQNTKSSNAMTMDVSLGAYPGRGVSLPVNLHYSSQGLWRIGFINSVHVTVNGYPIRRSVAEAIYAEHSAGGWTTSLNVPEIEWPKANDLYWYTGKPYAQSTHYPYTFRIARVFIHMPDGSTHELRKADAVYQDTGSIDMSGTFYAVDGSRMRFNSTGETTGTLYLPDGTRYILNGSTTQYIDRNGNTLNYDATSRQWTDTMGRVINMPWPSNPGAGDYTYSLPGISNSSITYTLKFRGLSDVLTPGSPALIPISDYYLPSPGAPPTNQGSSNFPQSTGTSTMLTSGYSDPEELDEQSYTYVVGRGQSGSSAFNPVVLAEIDLPNGQSYKFSYNSFGELDKVIYPTGGYQRYAYGITTTLTGGGTVPYNQGTRGITSRWISPKGDGSDEAQWTYSGGTWPLTVTAPDGTRSETFLLTAQNLQSNNFGYQDSRAGLPFEERVYAPQSQGGAMLRRTLTEYTQSSFSNSKPVPPNTINSGSYTAYRNPRATKTVSLMLDTGGDALAKTITYEYAANGYEFTTGLDRTASAETYFASVDQTTAQSGAITSISAGATASRAETTYLNDSAYINRNILGLPTSVVLKDGNSNVVSKSESFYDESAYPLLTYGDLTGNDYSDPGTSARGNVTTGRRYIDISAGTYLETHAQFDQCGNVRNAWNERGIQSSVDYSSTYEHAFATQTTSAVPDSSGAHGSNAAFTSSSTFDSTTGLVLTATDANGQVTTYSYQNDQGTNDPLNRLRKVTRPDGGWTKYSFGETLGNLYTMTEAKLDASRTVKSYQYVDPLGRASRAFNSEGGNNYIASDTIYDQIGRVWKVSNPYRTTTLNGIADLSHTPDWTVSHYDAMSRIDSVTLPDSSTVQTSYQGIYTTVTDQAGRQRRQKTDALGRIVRVDEPNTSGSIGTVDAPTQPSFYQYNTQGNLIAISQGLSQQNVNPEDTANYIQHRYFKYDSLGRLTYEKQAEQAGAFTASDSLTGNSAWSRKLVYDETISSVTYSGLLTTAYDARDISTQFRYDNLNRIYQVNYSDSTPTVNNYYDQAVSGYFNKGHLTQAATAAVGSVPATSQSYNFDLMGRVANNQQIVGDQSYTMSYGYSLGGAMTSEIYPSGRVVNYAFDDGARLSQVSSGSKIYANQFDYSTTQGLLKSVTLGNGGVETYGYNSRLQLTSLDLSRSGTQIQHYDYKYGVYDSGANTLDESKNTGQIARIEGFIAATKQWQQNFAYDKLGRLSSAREFQGTTTSSPTWLVNYDYDVFGNRFQYQSQNGGNPFSQVWVESGAFSQSTNRFTSGVTYDDAGNITVDSKFRNLSLQYDANNRQKQSSDGTTTVVSVYDAAGQRVATQLGGTLTNVLVYDAGGKLIAEYGAAVVTGGTQYVFSDHQGSPRAITGPNGNVISRHDYAPFGEELGAIGMRTSGQGYGNGDNARQKYAGMESDDSTGMDHTLWRQFDSLSGRWTAPDPYGGSMSASSPQSFNRYAYVNNDPINKVDPTGLMLSDIGVYQTNDPEDAQIEEHKALRNLQTSVNEDYAHRHDNGTVTYYGNRASYSSGTYNMLFGTSVSISAEITGVVPQNSSGLTLPTDSNDLAMLDTVLGEASHVGDQSWDMDESGEGAYLHPRHPNRKIAAWEVEGEMTYMIYTVDNRLHDWAKEKYTGWKDVIERDAKNQFLGYKYGQNIQNIGSDPASIDRARMAIEAIANYHANPLRNNPELTRFYYWKGIKQDNNKNGIPGIMKRGRAVRMSNTDFMVSEKRY